MKIKHQELMYKIISEQVHGRELYNENMFNELMDKDDEIVEELDLLQGDEASKIEKVNKFFIDNVKVRNQYFEAFREVIPEIPKSKLVYRTAYGALVKGEAMCAGFTEAARILLEIGGLETQTLLSKLPGHNKFLLHYVTAIKYDRGSGRDYYIMDPERERSCIEKGYDFREYLMQMTYIKPEEYFYQNKVGKNGVGPRADDYLAMNVAQSVVSKNQVDKLFNHNKQLEES